MNSLTVEIIGGLGNQMFQYAFGRALALENRSKLILDVSGFKNYPLRRFLLDYLNIEAEISSNGPENSSTIYSEPHFHYDAGATMTAKNMYFKGYWQSLRYFANHQDQIRSEFQLKVCWPKDYAEINDMLVSTNSVAVHVRRGDYASNEATRSVHGLAQVEYFLSAMSAIRRNLLSAQFFIFSDDIEWCKKMFQANDLSFVDIYPFNQDSNLKSCHDLHLMASCNHHILSNSTFSWWSTWIKQKKGKIVIVPEPWFATDLLDASDLVPSWWNKFPIDGTRMTSGGLNRY